MKRAVYLFISLLLMICNSLYSINSDSEKKTDQEGKLTVLATSDLYPLSAKWADEYNKLNPGTNIKVVNVTSQEQARNMIKEGGIGFVSNEFFTALKNESLWKEIVGRDVIVPVINAKNPFLEEIRKHGVSPDVLALFVKNGDYRYWGDLLKNGEKHKADYYCINDKGALGNLADFLKTDETRIAGINAGSSAEVVSAIQNDPYSIGFCKLIDLVDFQNQGMVENVRLLPIDRNGNGLIDSNEKIYDDINDFSRGVWIGKYPKALFSNIYSVANEQPENHVEVAFMNWVLSDGQNYLSPNGYSDLLVSERQSAADRLYNTRISAGATSGEKNLLRSLMFVIATIILIGLITNSIARQRKRKKAAVKITSSDIHSVLDQNALKIPKGIYFDKTHTWAFLEANGNVKVGIDDFLQHITGKITRIKMKSPGKKVKKGEEILSIIQNGKQLNLYAPVSGTIIEQNTALVTNSSSLNTSPYNDGWIYKIDPSNWIRESQLLFMADKQREFIAKEFSRLKDFLMTAFGTGTGQYAQVILQDGGEISDGVLSELGPEIWEDFQTNFIDPSRQVWFYEMF
jgi:glycine cleavage system H lipoate-binding protein/ABC-type phosphate transport system substrate-binding protein